MLTFWPSTYPRRCRPSRKAATSGANSCGETSVSSAIRCSRPGCCARAASGHVAAAPPRSAMKLRRLMQNCPSRAKPTKGQRCASQQNWLAKRRCGSFASDRRAADTRRLSASLRKTLGNDGLLRCLSRSFDQRCYLALVRKKDCVAARKFNDLRLGPLRHEPLKVSVDHPILFGDHGVARLLFPGCNRGLGAKCFTCNGYLRHRHEARDRLRRIGREIACKRILIH